MHFHRYEMVRAVRSHRYEACTRCEKRRIVYLVRGGHFPVDKDWVATGHFTPLRPPVRTPSTTTQGLK